MPANVAVQLTSDTKELRSLAGARYGAYYGGSLAAELWRQAAMGITHGMALISEDSAFLRLPPSLNRRQVLFIDGIRHAAEVADLAYSRLGSVLTELALASSRGPKPTGPFTEAFLFAWAIVDAVDRLRGLIELAPGLTKLPHPDGQPGFRTKTEVVRSLRNVADHLAQRVDYVLARGGTALGKLSWITIESTDPVSFLSCAIIPGTIATGKAALVNPASQSIIRGPSDCITLSAGEYSASLSEIMEETNRIVRGLEQSLAAWIDKSGRQGKQAGADFFVAVAMKPVDDDPSPAA